MYCQNCGNNIPEGSRFCDSCGIPVAAEKNSVPENISVSLKPQSDGASALLISKYEYFTKYCPRQTKTLLRAAWIVFSICTALSLAFIILFLSMFRSLGWVGMFGPLREVLSSRDYVAYVLFFGLVILCALLDIVYGALACWKKSTGIAICYLLFSLPINVLFGEIVWSMINSVSTLNVSTLNVSTLNVEHLAYQSLLFLAYQSLLLLLMIVTLGKFIEMGSAICVLTLVHSANKEYKKYIKERELEIAQNGGLSAPCDKPAAEPEESGLIECSSCGALTPNEGKFCLKCGKPLLSVEEEKNIPIVCPQCGNTLPDGSVFCMHCGQEISEQQ